MSDPDDLVTVFRTADSGLVPLIKSLLDAAGIEYVVQGDEALGLFPLGPLATGITQNLMAVTFLVRPEEEQAACEALRPVEDDEEAPADE
jgi:hypothetical protein